ncbi:MAG: cryptochrome/photolyase family protein [Microscillaceae bacterium]|nr:cryptochrome/photolyase family protein [Microscillaceae bacterium]MDW8461899.1 cryptochrome/photolyase family protein [Cytophagales bacterium]
MAEVRLILGDQLNPNHSWFKQKNDHVLYVMMEVLQETNYVKHHIQKIVAFFVAMRNFAYNLRTQGHRVLYLQLDDEQNLQTIPANLEQIFKQYQATSFAYQLPDEYRLDQQLKAFTQRLSIPTQVYDTEHFLTKREEVAQTFAGKKTYLLETFYRKIRKKYHLLMQNENEPLTGKWNYDAENRKKYDKKVPIPAPLFFKRNVQDIVEMLQKYKVETIGKIDAQNFIWACTRAEAEALLHHFVQNSLPYFGTYEDAMHTNEPFLFHSRLSFVMNVKLLHPLEIVQTAIEHWHKNQHFITIAQIEGFVRQIVGWREYMRGVYWANMPDYAQLNFFNHARPLPSWFWTGNVKMNCLNQVINQSLERAYAHHIQRLMVTGNFALLIGANPNEVDAWYLGIYADAIEWVEITNTRGMSQYADGGLVGSKPYVASANYMDKMSSYCQTCPYDKKKKIGKNSCPFNSLYWDFYARNEHLLAKNPRTGLAYLTLSKMDKTEKEALLRQAQFYLDRIEEL